MKKKSNRIYTSVTLEPNVVAYLETLGEQEDRDRSWLINYIVSEHAKRFGKKKTKTKK